MTRPRRALMALIGVAVLIPAFGARTFLGEHGADANQGRAHAFNARLNLAPRGPIDGTVTVTDRAAGRPIAPGFVGLSIEYPALPYYTGPNPRALDPVFVQLVRNLVPGQSPVIRIGGDSTDSTWWPVPGAQRPPGVSFTLTRRWLALTRALAARLRARLILGVDLEAGQPPLAAAEARALLAGVGASRILALEPGNEPTRYTLFPWYRARSGQLVWSRQRPYGFVRFNRDFSAVARLLPSGVALAGPTLGGLGFMDQLGRFLNLEPAVRVVTVHRYPLNRCWTAPGNPEYPTVARLLSADTSWGLGARLRRYVGIARRRRLIFRVDEVNSVACGGKRGVSTSFASALWALETLFGMASAGVDGVNIHTFPGAVYAPFTVSRVRGHWRATALPDYYGLLAFAMAAPPGSRLLAVHPSRRQLRVWATRAADGTIRVVLMNVDRARAHRWLIRPPAASAARVAYLTAPSVYATSNVRLGGATVDPLSGRLGPLSEIALAPVRGGGYAVDMPAGSAAVVTLVPAA